MMVVRGGNWVGRQRRVSESRSMARSLSSDVRAFWWQLPSWGEHGAVRFGWRADAPVLMKQGVARFTWEDGGDVGYGLVERSG